MFDISKLPQLTAIGSELNCQIARARSAKCELDRLFRQNSSMKKRLVLARYLRRSEAKIAALIRLYKTLNPQPI